METEHYALFEAPFGDGNHKFCMGWKEAEIFEEENNISLYGLLRFMISSGSCEIKYVRSVIRLALIGAQMPSAEAIRLINSYVIDRPIAEFFPLVLRILEMAFFGAEGEKDG